MNRFLPWLWSVMFIAATGSASLAAAQPTIEILSVGITGVLFTEVFGAEPRRQELFAGEDETLDDFPLLQTFPLAASGDNQNSFVSVAVNADLALSESEDSLLGGVRLEMTGNSFRTTTQGFFAITVDFMVTDGLAKLELDGMLEALRSSRAVGPVSQVNVRSFERAQDGTIANVDVLLRILPEFATDEALNASVNVDASVTLEPGEYRMQFQSNLSVLESNVERSGSTLLDLDVSITPTDADLFFWEANDGAFDDENNWEPEGVPESGDTTVFDRDPGYTVTFGTERAERARVERGSPAFSGGSFTLESLALEPGSRSLEVGTSADTMTELGLFNHTLNAVHVTVGRDEGRFGLLTVGPGSAFNGSGRLSLGFDGIGNFSLSNGATATNAEVRLAENDGSSGLAIIEDAGTMWSTGNIAVGLAGDGLLDVRSGAKVTSGSVEIGAGAQEDGDIDGAGAAIVSGAGSEWLSTETVVGAEAPGELEINDSGAVIATESFTAGLLACGSVVLAGPTASGAPLTRLATPLLSIGVLDIGFLEMIDGATIDAGVVRIGVTAAGEVEVDGAAAVLGADSMEIGGMPFGDAPASKGLLTFNDGGTVLVSGTVSVNDGGSIQGYGMVSAETLLVSSEATLLPGLVRDSIDVPCLPVESALEQKQAAETFDTLVVDGDAQVSGTVVLAAAGNGPGQFGRLEVKGDAAFTGALFRIVFQNGYAPRQGERIDFISADGALTITDADMEFEGVEPGFEFSLTSENGAVVFEALNDAVPSSRNVEPPTSMNGSSGCAVSAVGSRATKARVLLILIAFVLPIVIRRRTRTRGVNHG